MKATISTFAVVLLVALGRDFRPTGIGCEATVTDDVMSIFDPNFQVLHEQKYDISTDEYTQYIIPQQFIVGFNETIISDTTNVKQYIHSILKAGEFVNATALWFYQTTIFVGVTIAGVDDVLYAVLKRDPNVIFIEPVREMISILVLDSQFHTMELII